VIYEYTTDLAAQMGIKLSKTTLKGGQKLGCYDAYLLSLESNGKLVSEFIHQSDLDSLKAGSDCAWLEIKVKGALSRLQIQLSQ